MWLPPGGSSGSNTSGSLPDPIITISGSNGVFTYNLQNSSAIVRWVITSPSNKRTEIQSLGTNKLKLNELTLNKLKILGYPTQVNIRAYVDEPSPIPNRSSTKYYSNTIRDVPIPNANATGTVTISSNNLYPGGTLTAITDRIDDEDGINNASFTYTWYRNGSVISGETTSTYKILENDVNQSIYVRVQFEDNKTKNYTKISSTVIPEIPDYSPSWSTSPQIEKDVKYGSVLSIDASLISDANGVNMNTVTYQWLKDGQPIAGANGSTFVVDFYCVGSVLTVKVDFRDNDNFSNTITSDPTNEVELGYWILPDSNSKSFTLTNLSVDQQTNPTIQAGESSNTFVPYNNDNTFIYTTDKPPHFWRRWVGSPDDPNNVFLKSITFPGLNWVYTGNDVDDAVALRMHNLYIFDKRKNKCVGTNAGTIAKHIQKKTPAEWTINYDTNFYNVGTWSKSNNTVTWTASGAFGDTSDIYIVTAKHDTNGYTSNNDMLLLGIISKNNTYYIVNFEFEPAALKFKYGPDDFENKNIKMSPSNIRVQVQNENINSSSDDNKGPKVKLTVSEASNNPQLYKHIDEHINDDSIRQLDDTVSIRQEIHNIPKSIVVIDKIERLKLGSNEPIVLLGGNGETYDLSSNYYFYDNSGLMFHTNYTYTVYFHNVLTGESGTVSMPNKTKTARPLNIQFEKSQANEQSSLKVTCDHFLEGQLTRENDDIDYKVTRESYVVDAWQYSSPAVNKQVTMNVNETQTSNNSYEFNEEYLPNREYAFSVSTKKNQNTTGPLSVNWDVPTNTGKELMTIKYVADQH